MAPDVFSPAKRSEIMRRIRQPTGLEGRVRGWLEAEGVPHEMYPRVEGRPDVRVRLPDGGDLYVFIDGCFWHACPLHYREPKTNTDFWRRKIAKNVERDARRAGLPYRWVRIWECQVESGEFKEILRGLLGRGAPCRGS